MTFKRLLGIAMAVAAVAMLIGSVGAGAARTPARHAADLSTNVGVRAYLHSLGISPRGVVIQRGARNYAGPRCPGKRWTCARTTHTVVQVARAGGKNTFRCSAARCAVVQVMAADNTATCIKTTGITGSCTISQPNATGTNKAIVFQDAGKKTGLTQTASYTASITQGPSSTTSYTSVTNTNIACVHQAVTIDGSASKTKPTAVTVGLEAHQSITIVQNSGTGDNSVGNPTKTGSIWDCDTAAALTQDQTLTSTVTTGGKITQNQNLANSGPNQKLDIEQNDQLHGSGFFGNATGTNTATFEQTNTLTAIGISPVAPTQVQSSLTGGILAKVNQDSRDVSTAIATQTETQCEDAQLPTESDLGTCHTNDPDNPYGALSQTQHGPVHKAPGDSSQTGNSGDSFTVTQQSQQDNDTFSGQTNDISGGFHTDGTGTVSQTATIDGHTSTDTQAGSGDVSGNLSCTGSACTTTTPPPPPTIDSAPPNPSDSSSATFTFHDADATATFLCDLDGGGYAACSSPKNYTGLGDGQHTFSVKAKNPSTGAVGDPATYTWTISTNLITNGSFEADTFSYNGTLDLGGSNPLTGWTTLSNGTYPWGLPYPNFYNAGPTPYGNQWVIVGNFCEGGTWIEQTINTTVGQTYTLGFALASEEGGSGAQVEVSFPSGSSTASQTFTAPPRAANFWDTWAPYTMDFQASGTSVTIRLTGLAVDENNGCDAGIDNVSVTAAQTIG